MKPLTIALLALLLIPSMVLAKVYIIEQKTMQIGGTGYAPANDSELAINVSGSMIVSGNITMDNSLVCTAANGLCAETPGNSSWTQALADTLYYPLGSNPAGYITGYNETDPVWTADKPSYLTSATAASTYQPIGSYATSSNAAGWTNTSTRTSTNLDVYINTTTQRGLWLNSIGVGALSQIFLSSDTNTNFSIVRRGSQNKLYIGVGQNGSVPSSALVIDSSSNVGIGTDTPDKKLTVSGDTNITGTIRGMSGIVTYGTNNSNNYCNGASFNDYCLSTFADRAVFGYNGSINSVVISDAGYTKPIRLESNFYVSTYNGTLLDLQNARLKSDFNETGVSGDYAIRLNPSGGTGTNSTISFNYGGTGAGRAWIGFRGGALELGTLDYSKVINIIAGGTQTIRINGTGYTGFATTNPRATVHAYQQSTSVPALMATQVAGGTAAALVLEDSNLNDIYSFNPGGEDTQLLDLDADTDAHSLRFFKSGNSSGSPNSVGNGGRLGTIQFLGATNNAYSYSRGAYIEAAASQSWNTTQTPAYISFVTTPKSSTTNNLAATIGDGGTLTLYGVPGSQDALVTTWGQSGRAAFFKAQTSHSTYGGYLLTNASGSDVWVLGAKGGTTLNDQIDLRFDPTGSKIMTWTKNNRTGIMTTTPTQALDVNGSINASGYVYVPGIPGSGNYVCYNSTDKSLYRGSTCP